MIIRPLSLGALMNTLSKKSHRMTFINKFIGALAIVTRESNDSLVAIERH